MSQTIQPKYKNVPMIFLFGTQKSGTTWLRNIISHFTPINSQAEWQLPYLVEAAENHVSTLCAAPRAIQRKAELAFVRAAFSSLLAQVPGCSCDKSAYPCLPGAGRDDRVFAYAVDMGRYFFPRAKQVMIVRDPRDVFVSSKAYWPDLAERRIASFDDAYLREFINSWSRCNLTWLSAAPDFIVRYEDLKNDFVAQVTDLLSALDFEACPIRLRKVQAELETIDISKTRDPIFYRKGIVGDWQDEMTPHQNKIIWDAGAFAMEQFGYTRLGRVSCKTQPFTGLDIISFDRVIKHNDQAGSVFCTPDGLRCFVFDDGFYLDLNVVDLVCAPIDSDAKQIFLLLDLAWDDTNDLNGKWCAAVQNADASSEITQWFRASARPGNYGRATSAAFTFPIEAVQTEGGHKPIRIKIFNGAQTPITAWIKIMRFGLLSRSSPLSHQLSDLIEADPPPADPHNAFFRSVGWSHLHFAANFGSLEIVSRLVERGVSPDVAERNGATPLHRAADFNHLNIAEYLLNNGANPNAIDSSLRETPLDVALRKNHKEIAQLLRKHYGREYQILNSGIAVTEPEQNDG
ncbi:ankyrin repeat domain-containing protein [Methylocapsa polymorpha]|uniref:Ankyrin repeat domain-containing protein n=1 Tax=Methylocapsa polymorpha TaxID=3080828 RepID=A0ABZ0HQE1_9HYPH|nr:ankyrin repeat domain-containing protein [Methylocapsa sp. RX1]